jgi:MoxR-like ATPase
MGCVLAGRVPELRELHGAAVRAAAEGRGWVGLIGGEPGIGKTQLAAACAARLARERPTRQIPVIALTRVDRRA